MRRRLLPPDNKYSRGVVGIVAGSSKFPGAALLTVGGARRGDAGYVKFVSADKGLCDLVVSRFPDVVPIKSITKERIDALVIGPGAGALTRLPKVTPLVLDSAAIAAVRTTKFSAGQIVVVTPHEGELRYLGIEPRLLDSEQRRKIAIDFRIWFIYLFEKICTFHYSFRCAIETYFEVCKSSDGYSQVVWWL